MGITTEEKTYLIEQIDAHCGKAPLFYLKFCSKEKYADDICEGKLYANTPKVFRDKEIESGERGQGDQFELISQIKTERVFLQTDDGEVLLVAPKGTFRIRFEDDDNVPIVSFVGIPLRDMELIDADENHADFKLPFSDEEYEAMSETFGPICVIMDAKELNDRINKYCNENNCDYVFDKIEYCDQNTIQRLQAFNNSAKERFLYKNDDLSYQREYRLALALELPEDHYIRIGELENIKIIDSTKLKNLQFTIDYVSVKKEK